MTILKTLVDKTVPHREPAHVCPNLMPVKNAIIVDDCMSTMTNWADKSVDVIITHPDYPVPGEKQSNVIRAGVEEEMVRVSRTTVIIMSPLAYNLNKLVRDFGGLKLKAIIRGDFGSTNKDFLVLASGDSVADLPEGLLSTKVKCAPYSQQGHLVNHPHALPQEVVTIALAWFSRQKDVVCDPFCGSGIILSRAKEMKRHWIGMEQDDKYGIPLQAAMSDIIVNRPTGRQSELSKIAIKTDNKFGNAFVFQG